jgi:hypothetical protein
LYAYVDNEGLPPVFLSWMNSINSFMPGLTDTWCNHFLCVPQFASSELQGVRGAANSIGRIRSFFQMDVVIYLHANSTSR